MKKLTIKQPAGASVQIIELKGDPANPEPTELRIKLPMGEVSITRTTENEYWIHLDTRTPDENGEKWNTGVIKRWRLDRLDLVDGELKCNHVHGAMLLGL